MPQRQQIGNLDDFLDQMLSSWNDNDTMPTQFGDTAMLHQQQLVMPRPSQNGVVDGSSFPGVYNGFADSLQSQQFTHSQGGGDGAQGVSGAPGGQQRQRVRARRGQATDPHSIAERLRRERIAERMKGLQELVPNANKTDKASMLDEIIDYVKFLQLQVKMLSMSRLGGAAAVAPLVTERVDAIDGGAQTTNGDENALTMTEQQVAKLMEEDMGSAMQYLQGKGLCLMPISLASAISTATSHSLPHNINNNANGGMFLANGNGPSSPSASVLTVQSSAFVNQ